MDFLDEMRSAYRTAIKGKWKNLPQEILIHKAKIMFPMTTGGDTAMHLAVYSRKEEPTKSLLAATSEVEREFWTNSAGNTPLHEAAAVGNLAAVKLLVEYKKEDLLAQNIYGETPLFRAVRFGHLHIVEYILEDCEDYFSRSPINWTKEKEFPIIHAAIQSEKFDVVLRLVDFDKSLLEMKDEDGKTALYVLANMPLIFRSGSSMGSLEKIIYAVLPSEDIYKYNFKTFGSSNKDDSESSGALNNKKNEDLEAQHNPDYGLNFCRSNCWKYFVHFLTCYFWRFIFLGWPQWKQLYRKKQHHKLAVTITKMLAEIDYSWRNTDSTPEINEIDYGARRGERKQIEEGSLLINKIQTEEDDKSKSKDIDYDDIHETPLLLAAANGIIEIVEAIVDAHPPAIDYVTKKQRNVLHVAIAHRQSQILDWIEKEELVMARLVTRIDASGFTALHHAGITKFSRGGSYGPALQLQEELKWFHRVQDQIPTLYAKHHSQNEGTARQHFDNQHQKMLEDGKEWLKKTSESCSAVAVLIATVVFAAAYTVPGGLNSKTGSPVLVTDPIYMVFTVMDIVGLATSLTSVVLFLSILTSPFMMHDFLHALPLKLLFGFQLLFLSVASTMMAFALTIVLTMKSAEIKWTMSLLYMASFFPVTMFIIMQLPLYVKLVKSIWSFRHNLFQFLPIGFVTPFWMLPSKIVTRKFA